MYKDKKPLGAYIFKKEKLNLVHYRIVPDYTIENSQNEVISKAIASIYKNPKQRIKISLNPIVTIKPKTVAFFNILIEKGEANFYISFDNEYEEYFLNKMRSIWNKSAFIKVEGKELQSFDIDNTEMCELVLRDFSFKSLNCDKNNLYPLTNMLGITKDLKENEKIRVNYTIEPIKRTNWISMSKDEYKHFQEGKTIDNSKTWLQNLSTNLFAIVEWFINIYIDFRILLFESIAGLITMGEPEEEKQNINIKIDSLEEIKQDNKLKGLSSYTHHKMTSEAFKVAISILSQSKDCNRRYINLVSVANSYKDLNGDNELIVRKTKNFRKKMKNVIYFNSISSRVNKSIYSDKEVAKFIQLPQRTLLQEYDIEHIDTREIEVPQELQQGYIHFGIAEKQKEKIKAYLHTDKNIAALPIVISGPQNAWKTTLLKRMVRDSHTKAKYSNIYIDFIENCHNSKEVSEAIPDNEKIIIKLGERDYIPALAYNEVSRLITADMDPWDRVRYANMLSEQVEYLINSVTDKSTGELTAPMLRYLHAACMVTFIRPNATVNDVFQVLRKWEVRNDYIRYAKYDSGCFDKNDDIFYDLEELHDKDSTGKIIGTRENLIIGIINRITVLNKNHYIKAMLKADIDKDIDFTKLIEEGKSIFIQIPQTKFPNRKTKDILCTFFMSRIWLTVQLRENNKEARLCKVIFDEVHQVPTCASFLKNHITEFRRHRLGLIITCHYFKQFNDLFDAIKSAGTSYMLLAGTEKENLKELQEELNPFTIEEGLNLKPFHSLNIINYGNQYARFITKLPKPIK